MFLKGGIYWTLAAATSIGSVIAGPLGALTVERFGSKKLKLGMGLLTIMLGAFTLAGIFT